MQKKYIRIITAVVAAAILAAGPAIAQGLKIAVIDVNKVLNESEAGKIARKKMENRYEELKKRVDVLTEEAKKMKEDIEKQKILLGKEKLKAKEEALSAKVAELRKVSQESETEMQQRQRDLTRDVLKIVGRGRWTRSCRKRRSTSCSREAAVSYTSIRPWISPPRFWRW